MISYGDVLLPPGDALYGTVLDLAHGHEPPTLQDFNPADVELLQVQDIVGSAHGLWPKPVRERDVRRMSDAHLRQYIDALERAVRLPLSPGFHAGIVDVLDVTRDEHQRRSRRPRQSSYPDWRDADLLAEVEAVTGPLLRRGRSWWSSCPFHPDSTPSFHVDPERRLWWCFGCGAGGGVVAWRRRIEGRAA
jgi:hypothetical protein